MEPIGVRPRSLVGVPLPFPTHPVAVLPLKRWRPRWFNGVALVLGSMAPDLAYALDGSGWPVWPFSHEYAGLFGWCLPITLVGCWIVRPAAPVLAAHVPLLGDLRPVWPRTRCTPLPGTFLLHTTGVRLLCAVAAGLLVASMVVAVRPSRPVG